MPLDHGIGITHPLKSSVFVPIYQYDREFAVQHRGRPDPPKEAVPCNGKEHQ